MIQMTAPHSFKVRRLTYYVLYKLYKEFDRQLFLGQLQKTSPISQNLYSFIASYRLYTCRRLYRI